MVANLLKGDQQNTIAVAHQSKVGNVFIEVNCL